MKGRPLIVGTAGWLAGSSLAYAFLGMRLLLIWGGVTLLFSAAVLLRRQLLRSMLILWIAVTLSGAYWLLNDGRNVTKLPEALAAEAGGLDGMMLHGEGTVVSAVDVDGDRADFQLELRTARMQGEAPWGEGGTSIPAAEGLHERVMVQVKLQSMEQQAEARAWRRGDRIKLVGTLELPGNARNFGGFDYAAYLRTQHIHWLFKVKGTQNAQVSPPASPWSALMIFRWNDGARSGLGDKLGQIFREPHAGYMKGLLIGMQDDIDPETYSQFSQLGLTHILAISGMHVAVFVASLLFLFSLLKMTREKALLLTMLLIPVYVLISGVSPSVVRAGIMGMIGLYAARKGWLKDGMNVLAAAALLMMLWNPYYLLSVSFQLSFLVTAGLMVYVPLMSKLLRFLPKRIAGALNVTLVAQLVSFPLTVYYFNQFSLLSFAANFVLVPFITFVTLPLGAVSLLLGWIWLPAGKAAGWVTEFTSDWTFRLVRWLNGFPQFVTIWKSPSLAWIAAYFVFMYLILYLASRLAGSRSRIPAGIVEDETAELGGTGRSIDAGNAPNNKKMRMALTGIMLAFLFLIYWEYRPTFLNGAGLVQFLDVGQGDGILITTPEGRNILVDGGGTVNFRKPADGWKERKKPFEVGAKVVVPLLKQRGIHRLDAVIVTHGDQDHAGGLQAVLEQIPVKAFLFNGTLAGTKAFDKLMDTALKRRIPVYAVHQGMKLKPDRHTELAFISPLMDDTEQEEVPVEKSQNHVSVAFVLTMNERRLLFTGDMDKAAEEAVLEWTARSSQTAMTAAASDAAGTMTAKVSQAGIDVIKIAHHGSKSSSGEDWLHYWKPKAAVISAGVNNLYGHPHAEVVQRIEDEGAELFRTDQNGEVQMLIRPEGIRIRSKLGLMR
ncbi:ComEC/Rec2 family competence protein [Paenibacillus sp. VCA1]|uniref:ComEC/Rec2 family competence protein n=1 Tax=Paenibacillus sp. VCA1 TaxID=3039148 RepID=UPI002871B28F|nr:ComEC/Rec2 family competence protein [Paenibacillus sp. VCA1]MDR9853093.1 ComEC/Rec2 family competence protein [Paenibacillus sp. VCA1]